MPQPRPTLSLGRAREVIAGCCASEDNRDLVGVEVEWPIHREGTTAARPTLADFAKVGGHGLPRQGRVTIEPGGQVELSTQAFESPSQAINALNADAQVLHLRLAAAHLVGVDIAVDHRRPPSRVLDKPRYAAMEAHFSQRGRAGVWMMTNTASLQINISHGTDSRRRWKLVNRIGPLLVAAFANSPGLGPDGHRWKSVRQAIWSRIDAGRTAPVPLSDNPERDWADYALAADVFYLDAPISQPLRPAISFIDWIVKGHQVGWPTEADLCYHLTTLFPPIRPRHWLELRMIDALAANARPAAIYLTHSATRDGVADEVLATIADTRYLWDSAARDGLAHPALKAGVRALFRLVLDYLHSTPDHSAGAEAVGAFADRYILRDRCPADDLPGSAIDAFGPALTAHPRRTRPIVLAETAHISAPPTTGDAMRGTPTPSATDHLLREVTDDERRRYRRDGVVRLEQIIPEGWIDRLREAVDALMTDVHDSSQNYTLTGQPRFFSQAFPRFVEPTLNAWALNGPTKHIAAQMYPHTTSLRFFYDQVFAQEPGTTRGAPYHQDYPYLPINGEHYLRIWVPLDTVTADSGAIRYLKGSHRGPIYRPISFSGNPNVVASYANSPYPTPPDFGAYDDTAWFVGHANPGDAVLHHPRTVHGSPPNNTTGPRRAVTTIFVGNDVVWEPRPGTAFDHIGSIGDFSVPPMPAGAPIDGDLFPVVVNTA
ncbi:MAG: glutamate-cysteine ligase family protein [Mycobacterium sp.]